ncbi:hypothetical protein IAT38_000013 [Cryptococcus sp. DSM 104549]
MGDTGMRGIAASQDIRFKDKVAQSIKATKFPPHFSEKVDLRKVNVNVLRSWVAEKVTELIKIEDDIVVEYVFGMLEDPDNPMPDPKKMQVALVGFMDKHGAAAFMDGLWKLLLSAQKTTGGVPAEFIEAKKAELQRRQQEDTKPFIPPPRMGARLVRLLVLRPATMATAVTIAATTAGAIRLVTAGIVTATRGTAVGLPLAEGTLSVRGITDMGRELEQGVATTAVVVVVAGEVDRDLARGMVEGTVVVVVAEGEAGAEALPLDAGKALLPAGVAALSTADLPAGPLPDDAALLLLAAHPPAIVADPLVLDAAPLPNCHPSSQTWEGTPQPVSCRLEVSFPSPAKGCRAWPASLPHAAYRRPGAEPKPEQNPKCYPSSPWCASPQVAQPLGLALSLARSCQATTCEPESEQE